MLSGLAAVMDSPRSIENNFSADAISGTRFPYPEYVEAIRRVTLEQVIAAANTITLHSTLFLKGATE